MSRRFLRRTILLTLVPSASFAGLYVAILLHRSRTPAASVVVVDQLRQTRELIGLIVEVAEPRRSTNTGKLGGIEVTLMVHGEAHLGVDLSAMQIDAVDESNKQLMISLPPPTVRMAKVDMQRTIFVRHHRYGLWPLVQVERVDRQIVAQALADAEQAIRHAGEARLPNACQPIERAINDLAAQHGWEVIVRWR